MNLFDALQRALGEDYDLQRELGGGGMSNVFLARDKKLDRSVVVKVLSEHLAAGVSVERFNREVLVAAGLQHPHIVTVHSAGEADGLPYFVMPFVEGESLRKRIARGGPLSVTETVNVLRDVLRALKYAHDKGIVHRDIKPDNILLTSGTAMIADFGVAKALDSARHTPSDPGEALTAVGSSLGTPQYMAPEQAAGDTDVDHRADIYALGVTAFEMLTGDPPFAGLPPSKLLAAHITQAPPDLTNLRSDVPRPVLQLVRSALEKDPDHRPQSAAACADMLAGTVQDSHTTPVTGPVRSPAFRRTHRTVPAGIGVAAVVGIAAFLLFRSPDARTRSADPPGTGSIAVLPFVNVGDDPGDEYFADGMTDELISALHRIPDLRVSSRTAVYPFKGTNSSVGAIADSLGVATLLEGTIRHGGDRMRLAARLVDARDGSTLWSETYERQIEDVFAVQDELTASIVAALTDRVSARLAPVPDRTHGTQSLEAYDRYLRGRYFFHRRDADGLRRALEFFDAAVEQDPEFAEAHSGRADVLSLLPLYTNTPSDSVLPLAMTAANRALELDDGLATAYASRGSLRNALWDWDGAAADLRRATELDPRYATAFQWYGEHLLLHGRHAQAAEALGRAAELEPVSPIINASYGGALVLSGQVEEGLVRGQRAVELNPDLGVTRMMLGAAYVYANRPGDALKDLERGYALARVPPALGMLGYARAVTGNREGARALLADLDTTLLTTGNPGAAAHIYLGLGDVDRALHWLLVAARSRDPMFASESMASPVFESLYGDSRFVRILEMTGLNPTTFQ